MAHGLQVEDPRVVSLAGLGPSVEGPAPPVFEEEGVVVVVGLVALVGTRVAAVADPKRPGCGPHHRNFHQHQHHRHSTEEGWKS